MMTKEEKREKIKYLDSQIIIKRQQVEKLLQELKTICLEIIDLKEEKES